MNPTPQDSYDLVVIGAGPGGYTAALHAASLGMKVVVVDKEGRPGGTCLQRGCIPSKALLHSSWHYWKMKNHLDSHGIFFEHVRLDLSILMDRKEKVVEDLTKGIETLFASKRVQLIHGHAQIAGANHVVVNTLLREKISLRTRFILIATGSEEMHLPSVPLDEKRIVSSTGALSLKSVPKHLVIIGGGYIGLELGSVWSRLGAAVTVIDLSDRLIPSMDREITTALQRELTQQGLVFRLGRKVTQVVSHGKNKVVYVIPTESDSREAPDLINCDYVLVAVGRRPHTTHLGLSTIGITLNEDGTIPTNAHWQTPAPNVYAIGDVIRGPRLAHKAELEGIAAVERMAVQNSFVNYGTIPNVVYTHPEVASVGATEEALQKEEIAYNVGRSSFNANGRACATGETAGLVKVLAHEETDEVLGVHIMGVEASSLIAEAVLAMEFNASAEDIARSCHAHPTYSEVLKAAAFKIQEVRTP